VRFSDVVKLTEKLIEETPLSAADIPELVAVAEEGARLDAIRAAIAAELHPAAADALFALLDGGTAMLHSKTAETEALRALSPQERGTIFVQLLDVLTDPARFGFTHWGQLQREKGVYRFGVVYQEIPFQLGGLFLALTRRAIDLPHADATLARMFDLLPKLGTLRDRKFLGLFLDTAKQHPGGRTAAALLAFIRDPGEHHPFREFRVEIEDAIRFLPNGKQTAGAAAASPLTGLPPLPLPELDFDAYSCSYGLREHFENLLDARLYDEAHRDLIGRLAGLNAALIRHHDTGGERSDGALARLVHANGFPGVKFTDWFLTDTARLGAQLEQRLKVYAPFVTAYPEQARQLSTLTAAIRGESKPSKAWLKEGHAALEGVPPDLIAQMLDGLMERPIDTIVDMRGDAALRTLVLLASGLDPAMFGPRLATFALRHCYIKERGHHGTTGIRDERMGNACIIALSEMPAGAGIPYMARVQNRVNYPKIRGFIDKRFDAAAKAAKITRGELDELIVPVHGLDAEGTLTRPIGDGKGIVRLNGSKVEVTWIAASGEAVKSASAGMKADAAALKAFRAQVTDIKADITVQTSRLQRLYLENREWPLDQWRRRYAEHPLLGALAQRLVWWVGVGEGDKVAVMPEARGTVLRGLDGKPVTPNPAARVRLWHPIEASLPEIEAWRDRLEQAGLQQPFPQVWREVYLLTDAERTTRTYTNRWSGHILRQHQAMELARANGWSATHQTGFDGSRSTPWQLSIPAHGLVASYWLEGLPGADFSPGGAFTYITTDRMLFHRARGGNGRDANRAYEGESIALDTLPPVVFSEVMRCGDLFTAIASIGNDPEWIDRGADAEAPNDWRRRTNVYWHDANSAPLEQSGQSRRAILARIIPRLRIADRLSLDDRFLHVRGKLNAYSIHLGAGGAFCGTRHLCIVPSGEGPTGKIWLPFEGDRILSLILSKAVLLAADDKITDPVILAQIR
jgi:hypothetical protein